MFYTMVYNFGEGADAVGESTSLLPTWPGFVVGSLPCSESFFSENTGFPQEEIVIWNVSVWGEGETGVPRENLSEQGWEPKANSIFSHVCQHFWDTNLGHAGGRQVLLPLCHSCFHGMWPKAWPSPRGQICRPWCSLPGKKLKEGYEVTLQILLLPYAQQ